MTTSKLDQVLEEVKALRPDEQKQVRELVNSLLEPKPKMTEDEFERMLLEKGVIGSIPPSITDLAPYQNRKPIEVTGRPVSEFLLEERR